MKVIINETVKKLRSDPNGAKALRDFIATGKLNESTIITIGDKEKGRQTKVKLKIIPTQG